MKIFLPISMLIFFTWGCKKVLTNFDINDSQPQIVVEGLVTDSATVHYVRLSYSADFYSAEKTKYIDNASVYISDNQGFTDTLKYDTNGYYRTGKWAGIPGNTYYLDIYSNNIHVSAADVMPASFGFKADSISILYKEKAPTFNNYGQYNFGNIRYIFPGDSVFNVQFSGKFDGERPSYYRADLYRNTYKYSNPNTFFLFNTIVLEGYISKIDIPGTYIASDTVNILIYRVSAASFYYYASLRQLNIYEGGIFSSPSGNPVNNIKGSALGFFEAARVKKHFQMLR